MNSAQLRKTTKDQLVKMLDEANEAKEATIARYAMILAIGVFIGYALAVG